MKIRFFQDGSRKHLGLESAECSQIGEASDWERHARTREFARVNEHGLTQKGRKFAPNRQRKSALQEHADNEIFGFVELNSFYLTGWHGRVKKSDT